ncbi:EamA family transporter [Streptomyces sp. NBC_00210]|uniref:EamA family transporter n=1 Tax=unclassified Streptomyces TaxID=2593676 RepID=UPI0032506D10
MTDPAPGRALAGKSATSSVLPAAAATLCAMISVQSGAAVAVLLFDQVPPAGTAWLRLSFGALLLLLWTRPWARSLPARDLGAAAALGAASAAMTLCSFQAIDSLPLGTVSAVEFLGPLTVALFGSRRPADLLWPVIALAGVLLLTRPWAADANWVGIGFALGAAVGLAGYIVLTQKVADRFTGQQGIALSTTGAALFTGLAVGWGAEGSWWSPRALLISAAAAVLLPIIPHVLETLALRRLTAGAFGTLMSLEPAVGTGIGAIALAQIPDPQQLFGVVLVCVAGIAACRGGARQAEAAPRGDTEPTTQASSGDTEPTAQSCQVNTEPTAQASRVGPTR